MYYTTFRIQKRHSRFVVKREDDIKQWISVCDKIYFWWSTSIVEAFYFRKPVYVLRPYEIDNRDEIVTYTRPEKYIKDFDSFFMSLSSTWSADDYPIEKNVIDRYYRRSDIPTYIQIADMCEAVIKSNVFSLSQSSIDVINEKRRYYLRNMGIKERLLRVFIGSSIYPLYERMKGARNGRRELGRGSVRKIERQINNILADRDMIR